MTGPMEERRLVIDAAAVLTMLAEQPEGVPASSIYLALDTDFGRYERVVLALTRTGLAERTIDTITITPAGRKIAGEIVNAIAADTN